MHQDPSIRLERATDVVPSPLTPPPIVRRANVDASSVGRVPAIEDDVDASRGVVVAEIDIELQLVALDDDQGRHGLLCRRVHTRPA